MQIYLDEQKMYELVKGVVTEIVKGVSLSLTEGIEIHYDTHTVGFDPKSQDNVDTNDYIHPYIIENQKNGCTILSMFERKDNDEGTDGNPLVYALKGESKWRFTNPNSDIFALMRRFVSVTTHLQRCFDTLILTPSTNELNNRVFSYLVRLMSFDRSYNAFFKKLSSNDVREFYFNEEAFEAMIENKPENEKMAAREELNSAFRAMAKKNHGIFSYHYVRPLHYRDFITKSMDINYSGHSLEEYAEAVDGKDVLVFDDTVASGNTLSDSAQTLRNLFSPNSITFLTLFSPKTSQGFENKRVPLN